MRAWLSKVDLPDYSPHKFRHGHAVYAMQRAKDVSDIKALSQNLGHSNLSITDGVYGVLSNNDVKTRIESLGELKENGHLSNDDIDRIAEQVAKKLGKIP